MIFSYIVRLVFSGKAKKQFNNLKKRFEDEGRSMHAKGQFEWVDGVLVEALQDGEWLLVDNVNFCRLARILLISLQSVNFPFS